MDSSSKKRLLRLSAAGLLVSMIALIALTASHRIGHGKHGPETPYSVLADEANQRPEPLTSVKLKVRGGTFALTPEQLGWRLDDKRIAKAAGRKALPISNALALSGGAQSGVCGELNFFDRQKIPAYAVLNDRALRARLSMLAEETKKAPVNARIVKGRGGYAIRPATPGSHIDMARAFRSVRSGLAENSPVINVPVVKVTPGVTAQSLKPRLNQLKSRQAELARRAQAPAASVPQAPRTCADNPRGRNLILVSISAQHLWACSGPEAVYATGITTGAYAKGTATPTGSWYVYSKTANTRLVGPSWNYAVNYWMPFYSDYGFHDSSWQTFPYGSAQYASQGSHGCIHVPLPAMSWLYGWASVGTAVTITG